MKIKKILFVCLGNTARSPAAEYLARDYARKHDLDVKFQSAGFINAFSYMQPESRAYLDSKGISHEDFKPQLITRKLLEQHDLILTMERSHKRDILSSHNNVPGLEGKIFTLKEFNGENIDTDIIDPYYESAKMYHRVLTIIDEHVENAMRKVARTND